ncbi:hypothetical protein CBL_03831 [Carabus blaptoides fortunei]
MWILCRMCSKVIVRILAESKNGPPRRYTRVTVYNEGGVAPPSVPPALVRLMIVLAAMTPTARRDLHQAKTHGASQQGNTADVLHHFLPGQAWFGLTCLLLHIVVYEDVITDALILSFNRRQSATGIVNHCLSE